MALPAAVPEHFRYGGFIGAPHLLQKVDFRGTRLPQPEQKAPEGGYTVA